MTLSPSDLRSTLAYAVAVLVALMAGVMMASPTSMMAMGLVGLLGFVLSLPLLLRFITPAISATRTATA